MRTKSPLLLALALLALIAGMTPRADAQGWDKGYLKSLILAGNGTDVTNSITLVAPTLSPLSPYTLTLPVANASGILSNNGSGGLSWIASMTNPMTTLGDIVYASNTATPATPARLAGNTTTTNKFLTQIGTGSTSAAPAWNTIQASDLAAASGAAGSVAVLSRNSSTVTTSSATLVNATGLSFSIAANEIWSIDFELSVNAASAGGMAFGITIPTGATIEANSMGVRSSVNNYQCDRITASGTATLIEYAKANDGPVRITGLVVNGSTAGTVQLQFLSGTAGTNVTIYKNSYCLANRW